MESIKNNKTESSKNDSNQQSNAALDTSQVQAFTNQVAGHHPLLRTDGKVLKPKLERELKFYEWVKDKDLSKFIASFHGVTNVNLDKQKLSTIISNIEHSKSTSLVNPWSVKTAKSGFDSISESSQEYIILDDLTVKFKKPNICDIKIGTRQHGDDVPADKKIRHSNKVKTTTSKPLGLRMCGIQSWHPEKESYSYFTKYEGRKLTPETIVDELEHFFTVGQVGFKSLVVEKFIVKLKELLNIMISVKDQYRFYSSSLLLMFEASSDQSTQQQLDPKIELKMVDFAHAYQFKPGDVNDDGYVFGLSNFISILEKIQSRQSQSSSSSSVNTSSNSSTNSSNSSSSSQHSRIIPTIHTSNSPLSSLSASPMSSPLNS